MKFPSFKMLPTDSTFLQVKSHRKNVYVAPPQAFSTTGVFCFDRPESPNVDQASLSLEHGN